MRLVLWGTYDLGKPRNRILIEGLKENGVAAVECHADIWSGVEDKTGLGSAAQRLRRLGRWLAAYPRLIVDYLRAPAHDAVFVGYLGHLDVLVLWPFARLRGVPIVWDAFISLYDTVVDDRKLVGPRHPLAWLVFAWEWLACRAADLILLDTRAHADYFAASYRLGAGRVTAVPVGAEAQFFARSAGIGGAEPLTVLFYGQFIPLHGIETIIRAARQTAGEAVRWVVIGRGQEAPRIRALLEREPVANLEWIPWVDYRDLPARIAGADICLGIFGDTAKASRVVPNKVFQVLAAGKPLITRDSPAIRELVGAGMPGVYLVPPADPAALVAALRRFAAERRTPGGGALHQELADRITPRAVGATMLGAIERLLALAAVAPPQRMN